MYGLSKGRRWGERKRNGTRISDLTTITWRADGSSQQRK
jgi:hypothetical protein